VSSFELWSRRCHRPRSWLNRCQAWRTYRRTALGQGCTSRCRRLLGTPGPRHNSYRKHHNSWHRSSVLHIGHCRLCRSCRATCRRCRRSHSNHRCRSRRPSNNRLRGCRTAQCGRSLVPKMPRALIDYRLTTQWRTSKRSSWAGDGRTSSVRGGGA